MSVSKLNTCPNLFAADSSTIYGAEAAIGSMEARMNEAEARMNEAMAEAQKLRGEKEVLLRHVASTCK